MALEVGSFFTAYRYTPGRRAWMLAKIRERASERQLASVVARSDALIPVEEGLADELRRWSEVRAASSAEATSQLLVVRDQNRDRLLGDSATFLETVARLKTKASGQAAARLSKKLFPEGSRAIITMPYPDETAAIDALLKEARSMGEDVATAGVADFIDDLTQANSDFKTAYDGLTEVRSVDYRKLREADAAAQERFLVFLAHVIDTTHGTPDFEVMLDPVDVQQKAMKALYQSRRAVPDVNPKTGEDLSEPVVPASPTPDPTT